MFRRIISLTRRTWTRTADETFTLTIDDHRVLLSRDDLARLTAVCQEALATQIQEVRIEAL